MMLSIILYLVQDFVFPSEIPRLIIIYSGCFSLLSVVLLRIAWYSGAHIMQRRSAASLNLLLIHDGVSPLDAILHDIRRTGIYTIVGYQ